MAEPARNACAAPITPPLRQTWPDGRSHLMRLTPIAGFTNETVKAWARQNLAPKVHVIFDGLQTFARLLQVSATHERHVTDGGRQAVQTTQLRWVNAMQGKLKTALAGTCPAFDHARYEAHYLAEFAYRFNRRFDLAAMLPRLLRVLRLS